MRNPQSVTTVLLADDHPMFLVGVKSLIGYDPTFKVVAEVGRGDEVLGQVVKHKPDISVLDINMPGLDGLEVARQIRDSRIQTKVVMLTVREDEESFYLAVDAEAVGYVLKDAGSTNMLHCLREVREGNVYFSPKMSKLLVTRRVDLQSFEMLFPGMVDLTKTEGRVLKLISEGKTTAEIALALAIKRRTVDQHRRAISTKLKLKGANSLLKWAIEHRSTI